MLSLDKISITHFKNYNLGSFEFTEDVVGICGLNGKGKTNLLDAIYYCCFTRSYFSGTDQLNINFEKEGFRLEGLFTRQGARQKVTCIHRGTQKKEFFLNDVPYQKYSKHIGFLPAVMIAPDDVSLISGSSEERRRFIDTLISQLDPEYLQELITYNKILQQRNSLLKKMDAGQSAGTVLEILDQQLTLPGRHIHEKRIFFLQKLIPQVKYFYNRISGESENVSIEYLSQLNEQSFTQLLTQNRTRDLLLQRSNAGIHKDDIQFNLDKQIFKQIASQGQRKSLLFALKFAEYSILRSYKGFAPLLLLDDVFEKLDDVRMQQLLHWVCRENKGKVFITDTHQDRLEQALAKLDVRCQIIAL